MVCKGFLVSHGWRKRIKVTWLLYQPLNHVLKKKMSKTMSEAWEEVKIDLAGEGDDDEQMQDDEDVTMKSPEQETSTGRGK